MRLYPAGTVGGQVIGFVGREGAGLAGIEQTFQDELAGTPGQRRVEVGSGGNPIPSGIDESSPATDGDSVNLTLDQDLQYVTEQRLEEACADGATTRASAVVLDVTTGRGRRRWARAPATTRATTRRPTRSCSATPSSPSVFEPGSVMKAVTLSAALEEGVADAGHRAQRQRPHRGRRPGGDRRPRPRADRLDGHRDPRQVQQRRHDHAGPRGRRREARALPAGLRARQHHRASNCPARAPASWRTPTTGAASGRRTSPSARASR